MSNIEKLYDQASKLCPHERVPWLLGFDDKKVVATRGSCNLWACQVCGARNGKKWLARILDGMRKLNKRNWYFITLTAHQKMRGLEASLKNIREGWKKLYNRMRRKYGVSTYVKVWECHEDGTLHLHALIARKIGKRWLKDNAVECGMGYQVDSSRSKNPGQVAGYVAKYLLKGYQDAVQMPKGLRRIEASRDWPKLPENASTADLEWLVTFSRDDQERALERNQAGRTLVDLRPKHDI